MVEGRGDWCIYIDKSGKGRVIVMASEERLEKSEWRNIWWVELINSKYEGDIQWLELGSMAFIMQYYETQ